MEFWIGTSGFQYPEWRGGFYPENLPARKMLPYYAERLTSTESNYSFRTIPSLKTIDKWARTTPAPFKFSLKAPQKVTHFARLRNCARTVRTFDEAIAPLGKKLGVVLFQLPPNFKKDTARLAAFLSELPPGMRAAFEFRHASWFDEEVFAVLRKRGAALCIAESDEFASPALATAKFGYLRLRREYYDRRALAKWAKFVGAQRGWREVFVYFKHEERGVGPKFALTFRKLLKD